MKSLPVIRKVSLTTVPDRIENRDFFSHSRLLAFIRGLSSPFRRLNPQNVAIRPSTFKRFARLFAKEGEIGRSALL